MGVFEIIGRLILGIGALVIVAYLWGLFTAWLSKVTNSNISYHGKTVSRPDYHDENMKEIKEAKEKIVSRAQLLIERVKSLSEKKMTTAEKIKALKDLEELKNDKVITQEQYDNLKSKLL